ncbi:MAG: CPBP family intramembrane metalloprotease [Gammaproteobacteria bacterium]|nr:CPBP family intramembrane metalloprotease [Gammaproteobacteria bacterium]
MLGILVILVVSWLLLHFSVKKDLLALGFTPVAPRLLQFFVGILVMLILLLLVVAADTWWYQFTWQKQESFSLSLLGNSAWYYFKAVLTEDLVFRGAILYILVKKLGPKIGVVLSAIAFGIYHWFSFGLLNGDINIVLLTYVFITTGLMGLAWAYTFVRTQSIIMPLGMHLGWNQAQALFYPNQPYGELLYKVIERVDVGEGVNLIYLLAKALIIPALVMLLVFFYTKDKEVET